MATRQSVIRSTLRHEYQQGAVNEPMVLRLRREMTDLAHNHRWAIAANDRECVYCLVGSPEYFSAKGL